MTAIRRRPERLSCGAGRLRLPHLGARRHLRIVASAALLALVGGDAHASAANGWSRAAGMTAVRYDHTATALPDGRVLVAGGTDGRLHHRSAELYDQASDAWTPARPMADGRGCHTATVLASGSILVAGGQDDAGRRVAATERYAPRSNTWSPARPMSTGRYCHTATVLPDGKLLVTGGFAGGSTATSGAELYDPEADTWTVTASMSIARYRHTATPLPDGRVLVTGGSAIGGTRPSAAAEIYDPATATWSAAASMVLARYRPTATALPDGRVLVAGGDTASAGAASAPTASAELYDPAANTWSPAASMGRSRLAQTATRLANGTVLVTGAVGSPRSDPTTELYDPASDMWSPAPSMSRGRSAHTATLLADGAVLTAGGTPRGTTALAAAELFGSARAGPGPGVPGVSNRVRPVSVPGYSGRALACRTPGAGCRPVTATTLVAVGSYLDTSAGALRLETFRADGSEPDMVVYGGVFRLEQAKIAGAQLVVRLTGPLPTACRSSLRAAAASARTKKRKSRRLWSDGAGEFKVVGRHGSASVRGTKWLVEDRCDGTLVRVTRGVVEVRDFGRRRTVLVRAPRSYVVRPRR